MNKRQKKKLKSRCEFNTYKEYKKFVRNIKNYSQMYKKYGQLCYIREEAKALLRERGFIIYE